MTRLTQPTWFATLAAVSCVLAGASGTARAADEERAAAPASSDAPKAEEGAKAEDGDEAAEGGEDAEREGRKHEKEKEREKGHEEEIGTIFADMVLGWGKVPFAVQNPAGIPNAPQEQTYSRSDQVPSNVQSFIFGANVELFEHFEAGVRVPLTFASFNPDGSASRSTVDVGNAEFEGEYGAPIAKGLRLTGALGVAIPTANGTELPEGLTGAPAGSIDAQQYDHWSLAKAAAYARGYEDNALFEPGYLGIIPKIGLLYRVHGLSIEPYIKVENLVGTQNGLSTNYVGELVGALRVGYWVHKEFELAVRGWFNTGFAGSDEDKTTSATVEPQIVLRFGPVRPYVGLLVPVAGPPNDNGFIGARLGVDVRF